MKNKKDLILFSVLCFVGLFIVPHFTQSNNSKTTSTENCYNENNDTMSTKMPILFVGHGNPMNALENNEFTRTWEKLGKEIPSPKAIICISAHWESAGSKVMALENPPTIHDFGGFPAELYAITYPAKGNVALANELAAKFPEIKIDTDWGLDHGTWSVLKFMYPKADVPIIQVSLDLKKSPNEHYALAKKLAYLREKGYLIIGSGNIVHNLSLVDWNGNHVNTGYDWAIEANEKIKSLILKGDHSALSSYNLLGEAVQKAIPTPDHYLPLLYILALQEAGEKITFYNDSYVMGSISMTCVKIG